MLAPARFVPELRVSTGRGHGSKTKSPKVEPQEVQSRCEQDRRERDAPAQAWDVETRQEWSWRQGQEPQAGDRNRALRSAEKGREGSAQTHLSEALVAPAFVAQALVELAGRRSVRDRESARCSARPRTPSAITRPSALRAIDRHRARDLRSRRSKGVGSVGLGKGERRTDSGRGRRYAEVRAGVPRDAGHRVWRR